MMQPTEDQTNRRGAPPVSVICTVRNEEESIGRLLQSLREQSLRPAEVVICDGGSSDRTVEIVRSFSNAQMDLHVIVAPDANISRGRNLAIAAARHDIIASVDAGVTLPAHWLEELVRPFTQDDPPAVVSGFFRPDARSVFELAMGATVLPCLEEIEPSSFLPSSRSVAFTRQAWQRAGGYPEWLDYCEDLVFDLALRKAGCRFAFAPRAAVAFRPRSDLRSFFLQYYRYARGDGKADLWRKRHAIRYVTYACAPLAFVAGMRYNILWLALVLAAVAYCWKPVQRLWPQLGALPVSDRLAALALVPLIRLTGDVAKMAGYPPGVRWRLRRRSAPDARPGLL